MSRNIFMAPPWIATMAGWATLVLLAALSSGCVALFFGAAGGAAGTVYVMGKLT
ncbi:MAG: hypothetical protein HOP32_00980, partial [Nitrospira sp.]|nr:hypothetical protein [Nitrospira sp.]